MISLAQLYKFHNDKKYAEIKRRNCDETGKNKKNNERKKKREPTNDIEITRLMFL